MLNPKRLLPPPKQKTQSHRPNRGSAFLNARRAVARGIRTARRRVEGLQLRGMAVVQQLVETITPPDLPILSEMMNIADRPPLGDPNVVGSLLSRNLMAAPPQPEKEEEAKEEKYLVCEIRVVGVEGELKELARKALTIRPNFSYTLKEVNDDLKKVMGTGYFQTCNAKPEDTRDGIVLRIDVEPNPEVKGIVSKGGNVLPQRIFEQAVGPLLGKTLNFNEFDVAANQLNDWYTKEGILGEVIDASFVEPNIPVLKISEASVNRINLRYHDAKTGEVKEEGSVKREVVMRHMGTREGGMVSNRQAQRDVEAIFATGLFADVKLSINMAPNSTGECPKFDYLIDVYENRKTGGLGLGAGWSGQSLTEGSLPGFVGNVEYIEKNMFGLGQRLLSRVEFGQADKLFKVRRALS